MYNKQNIKLYRIHSVRNYYFLLALESDFFYLLIKQTMSTPEIIMSNLLADDEIQSLIDEEKRVSLKLSDFIPFKNKKGHKEQDISIKRNDGGEFKIILKLSKLSHGVNHNLLNVLFFFHASFYFPCNK